MDNLINLDVSNETVIIETNFDRGQFINLMEDRRVKNIFDVSSVCSRYGESSIDAATTAKLVELGFATSEETELGCLEVDVDTYVDYLLQVMEHVNPKFEYDFYYIPSVNVGGKGIKEFE